MEFICINVVARLLGVLGVDSVFERCIVMDFHDLFGAAQRGQDLRLHHTLCCISFRRRLAYICLAGQVHNICEFVAAVDLIVTAAIAFKQAK